MSYGLRVWDSSGVLSLEITNRLSRFSSQHAFSFSSGIQQNQSISVPGITTDGTWLAVVSSKGVWVTVNNGSVRLDKLWYAAVSGVLLVFKA